MLVLGASSSYLVSQPLCYTVTITEKDKMHLLKHLSLICYYLHNIINNCWIIKLLTFGVWPFTLPARASDPCTLPVSKNAKECFGKSKLSNWEEKEG